MKKFLLNLAKFISIPLIILSVVIFVYVKRDIYQDFGPYDNYSWTYRVQTMGDLSTKKLLNSKTKYDSFIFGSSRAISVYACYLQQKLKGSKFFHYANWGESIGGIYEKLNLIDSLGYDIKNVFIYIDTDDTFNGGGKCLPGDHYLLTKQDKFDYYFEHFKGFLSQEDLLKIMLGKKLNYYAAPDWDSDPVTNDGRHHCSDSTVLAEYGVNKKGTKQHDRRIDSLKNTGVLYDRQNTQKVTEKQISPNEEKLLEKIKILFDKHKTKYYIVITPIYDMAKFEESDLKILKDIFGDNLYDFSGENKYTLDEYNYNDMSHFQYYITKEIIDSVVADHAVNPDLRPVSSENSPADSMSH